MKQQEAAEMSGVQQQSGELDERRSNEDDNTTTSGIEDESSRPAESTTSTMTMSSVEETSSSSSKSQLNQDCLEYIQKNSSLIYNSLSFLFDVNKREMFFKILSSSSNNVPDSSSAQAFESAAAGAAGVAGSSSMPSELSNSLNRFIQLYVPLDYMKHMSVQSKLNMITQFLLTNKTDDETKIELIIDLANYYALKQEWHVVLDLLNGCTQDSEELVNNELIMTSGKNEPFYSMLSGMGSGSVGGGIGVGLGNIGGGGGTTTSATAGIDNLKDFLDFNRNHARNFTFNESCSAKLKEFQFSYYSSSIHRNLYLKI